MGGLRPYDKKWTNGILVLVDTGCRCAMMEKKRSINRTGKSDAFEVDVRGWVPGRYTPKL